MGRTRGEDAARRLDRGDRVERDGSGEGQKAGHRRPARGTRVGRRENVGPRRRERGDVFGAGMGVRTTARRPPGARRPPSARGATASQRSHCTHASEHSGWSSATSARLGPSSSSPMAAGERKSPFFSRSFPIAISRAPRGRTRRSARYARDRSPRRESVVRAGPVADRDRPTTLRRRCTAEWTHARIVSRRFFRSCARFERHGLLPNVQNEILGRVENGADRYTNAPT